jgi:hypothetical protein
LEIFSINFSIMITIRIAASIAFASVLVASSVDAQSDSVAQTLCWNVKPRPACAAWVVSEFGLEKGVISTHRAPGAMDSPTTS